MLYGIGRQTTEQNIPECILKAKRNRPYGHNEKCKEHKGAVERIVLKREKGDNQKHGD